MWVAICTDRRHPQYIPLLALPTITKTGTWNASHSASKNVCHFCTVYVYLHAGLHRLLLGLYPPIYKCSSTALVFCLQRVCFQSLGSYRVCWQPFVSAFCSENKWMLSRHMVISHDYLLTVNCIMESAFGFSRFENEQGKFMLLV
jgi:hypothetical protein